MNPPVVIIGAPRSGTNMLRDAITALPGLGTWPCDEIPYIWRRGNLRHPSDVIPPEAARPDIIRYIRGSFEQLARRFALQTVVEKTCSNSLRVPFVDRVLPDARYVFIVRDGIDAAASARHRWNAELDLPYILRKVRYVPKRDVPYYGLRFAWNRAYRMLSKEKRLAFWGPRLENMDSILRKHSLEEVCILQWAACVERSEAGFAAVDPSRVYRIRYEEFVQDPSRGFADLCEFLGVSATSRQADRIIGKISARSVGKGRRELGAPLCTRLGSLAQECLESHGYAYE